VEATGVLTVAPTVGGIVVAIAGVDVLSVEDATAAAIADVDDLNAAVAVEDTIADITAGMHRNGGRN
jgi:urea transporter